jgi:hypothetical protein
MHHPVLEGNGLKVLTRMHIPGLDMLTSDPEAVIHSGWMTAALPCSAAVLSGRRRVMTEVSDFSQKMGGAGPVDLADMQATAAWQATWGVTDFTLYYGLGDRPPEATRAYGDFVGRLNAVLKPAGFVPDVLLYYPIHDLWSEYLPVAQPLKPDSQSPRAQQLVRSFKRLGQHLQRNQVPFVLIDHEHLARAGARSDGTLALGDRRFRALVIPAGTELPEGAAAVVHSFRRDGGCVVLDRDGGTGKLLEAVTSPPRLSPGALRVALGRFTRDGRGILALVNVGNRAYEGHLNVAEQTGSGTGDWLALDPATGDISRSASDAEGRLSLSLAGRQTILFVSVPGE